MPARRDFLRNTAALAAAAALAPGFGFAPGPAAASMPASKRRLVAFFDPRYTDSVAFASALQSAGARVVSTADDLGASWHGELGQLVREPDTMMVGLTTYSDFFISAGMAREHGARCIFQGMHDCRGRDELTHSIDADPGLRGLAAQLDSARGEWAASLAQRIVAARAGTRFNESVVTRTRRTADNPGMLYSWSLA